MAGEGGINGTAVFAALAGSVLLYSGLKGKSISSVARSFLEGKNPGAVPQTKPIATAAIIPPGSPNPFTTPLPNDVSVTSGAGYAALSKQYSANGPERLTFAQARQAWTLAGGPGGATSVIAAAITMPEAGLRPGAVQAGQPYSTTGWGLWQITPGNSVPSAGTDNQLLVPLNNAKAAVAKYRAAGGFSPWVTYTNGSYAQYLTQAAL